MISILNRQRRHRIPKKKFRALLERLARRYGLRKTEVSLSFVGPARIRSLNRRFRKRDVPTDVLSFPLGGRGADGLLHLGDIVVAPVVAARRRREEGRGLERELEFLAVHGFLHLLGYDHGAKMEKEERAVGRSLCRGGRT